MKKVLYFLTVISVLSLTACNFGVPSNIKVKSKADYKFCVADKEVDLGGQFKLDEALGSLQKDGSGIELYPYRPAGNKNINKKQILLVMPFQSIPLDFDSYLQDTDFSASEMSIPMEIPVPEVNMNKQTEFDASAVKTVISAGMVFNGTVSASSQVTFSITGGSFGYAKYSYGIIQIASAQPNLIKATVTFEDGTSTSGYFSDGTVSLYINDPVTINSSGFKIEFSGDGLDTTQEFVGKIDSDYSKITEVGGLKMDYGPVTLDSVTIPVAFGDGSSTSIKSVTIDEGNISMGVTFPNWEEVSSELDVAFAGAVTGSLDSAGKLSLNDKTIVPGDITATESLTLHFNNATLNFESTEKPKVNFGLNISKIKNATIGLGSIEFSPSVSQEIELPAQVCEMVSKITWKKSGISVRLKDSNLPEGNNIAIKNVKSTFFGIDEAASVTLTETAKDYFCADFKVTEITNGTKIGLSAAIDAFNYDSSEKTIELKNFKPGETYHFTIEVAPQINWYKIEVNTNAFGTPQTSSFKVENFDLSAMMAPVNAAIYGEGSTEKITDKLKFKSLPLYLYCSIPDCLNTLSFKGKITASLKDDSNNVIAGTDVVHILGSNSGDGVIKDNSGSFVFTKTKKEKDTDVPYVTSDVSKLSENPADFKSFINNPVAGNFVLDYTLQLDGGESGVVIGNPKYKEEFADGDKILNSGGDKSIQIVAYVPVVLDFEVASDIDIDVMKLMGVGADGTKSDLFGRESANSTETMEKLLSAIESVDLYYKPSIIPVGSSGTDPIKLKYALYNNSEEFDNGELSVAGGTVTLNPSKVLKAYPFTADLNIIIPKGDIYIPDEMRLKANIGIGIHTNGEFDLNALKSGN